MTYLIITMPILIGFGGLAVDVARFQVDKSQAQQCADAAARYAAKGAADSSVPQTTAVADAQAVAASSYVDGAAPTINAADVVIGDYDASTKKFTTDSDGNCVKVTVRQTLNRSGGIPPMMSIFTNKSQQVTATAIARCAAATTTTLSPPASGNLWLSGMPNNTTTQNLRPDDSTIWDNNGTTSAPKQRPLQVSLSTLNVVGGGVLNLEGLTGTASWENNNDGTNNTADGDPTYLVANGVAPAGSVPSTSNNGMSNVRAPIGAVMGVFLNDNAPTTGGAPANLDFGTDDERNYSSVSPQLKQVFFIGDGKRDNGELQSIVVPNGATRLFLGMMDAWQWNDNVGNFTTKLYGNNVVTLVK